MQIVIETKVCLVQMREWEKSGFNGGEGKKMDGRREFDLILCLVHQRGGKEMGAIACLVQKG